MLQYCIYFEVNALRKLRVHSDAVVTNETAARVHVVVDDGDNSVCFRQNTLVCVQGARGPKSSTPHPLCKRFVVARLNIHLDATEASLETLLELLRRVVALHRADVDVYCYNDVSTWVSEPKRTIAYGRQIIGQEIRDRRSKASEASEHETVNWRSPSRDFEGEECGLVLRDAVSLFFLPWPERKKGSALVRLERNDGFVGLTNTQQLLNQLRCRPFQLPGKTWRPSKPHRFVFEIYSNSDVQQLSWMHRPRRRRNVDLKNASVSLNGLRCLPA